MKKTASLAALLCVASLATIAQAQTQAPPWAQARSGGGFFGVGVLNVETNAASTFKDLFVPGGTATSRTTGYKLYGGYLWGNWGLELGLYDLGTHEIKSGATQTDKFETQAYTISAVYSAPIGQSAVVNLKAGMGQTSADYKCVAACGGGFVDTKKTAGSFHTGFGLGWRVTPALTLRGDMERFRNVKHSAGSVFEQESSYAIVALSAQVNF